MTLGGRAHDREARGRTRVARQRCSPRQNRCDRSLGIRRGQPRTLVAHGELDDAVVRVDRDVDATSLRPVDAGVLDEVRERTLERVGVSLDATCRRPPRARPAARRRRRGARSRRARAAWPTGLPRRPRARARAGPRSGSRGARRRPPGRRAPRGSAPWRAMCSAFPRSAVSGVRSSCDASATKRRSRSRACSSAPSIVFSVPASSLSSSPVAGSGSRRVGSLVRAISRAPSESRASGRSARRARPGGDEPCDQCAGDRRQDQQASRLRERGVDRVACWRRPARLLRWPRRSPAGSGSASTRSGVSPSMHRVARAATRERLLLRIRARAAPSRRAPRSGRRCARGDRAPRRTAAGRRAATRARPAGSPARAWWRRAGRPPSRASAARGRARRAAGGRAG